jgi:enoyl-CoA hydratase/carnithine racemase
MAERVRFDVGEDGVGLVTLDRADKLNALDHDMFEGLHAAADRAAAAVEDRSVRAVLIIGAGRAFSAGLDTSIFGAQTDEMPSDEWIAALQSSFTKFEDLPVPTVAAVKGVALGGGCQLAIAAHLRVAAPDAQLGILEARWAIIPDLGGTYRLPRLIGLSRAIDLAVTARTIDAQTALEWGLVDAILDGDDFAAEARAYAALLAAGPTAATGAVPRLMREGLSLGRDEVLARERAAQVLFLGSDDFSEAVRAAMAREAPRFGGC